MVTIKVDEEVWRHLTLQKDPGDSFNDVLRRELGLSEPERNADGHDDVEAVLERWDPGKGTDSERARQETLRAYRWLSQQSQPQSRADFQDALAADADLGKRSWWDRAVQPGLRQLVDADLVTYRSGYHDYRVNNPMV